MKQLTLGVLEEPRRPPHARGSDTSKAAADSVEAETPRLRGMVLDVILRARSTGLTCDEAEVILGMRHQTISARFRELAKIGSIQDSGRRRPTRSGRRATVWVAC